MKTFLKRAIVAQHAVTMLLGVVACASQGSSEVNVVIGQAATEIKAGDSIKLVATVTGADDKTVTWSSSDESILKVDQDGTATNVNTTGSKVTELYLYDAGSEDKGENLAGEGLADGESIVITRDVEADKQGDVVYVLEFTTEDGNTQSFDTLHYEVAPISLKSVDAAAGATAIAFEAPQK